MSSWLDPVRRAFDAAPSPITFFFRDDDAGWEDEKLYRLLDVMMYFGAPIAVAAIPMAIQTRLAADLRALVTAPATVVSVHQHGFAHVNHEATGRKSEFGPSRSRDLQRRDVADGKQRLEDALGLPPSSMFTPPWNRCTTETAECLVELGFDLLSRDITAEPLAIDGLRELRVHGVVVDESGAALPGATVVLTRDGGSPRETTSDPTGNFAFANVGPGQYRVRVELTGFQPADLPLVVGSSEPPSMPVRLKIGFDEEVTVAAQRSGDPLSPSGNADAVEFDPDALRRLPLDMQNLRMLIENFTAAGSAGGASFVIDGGGAQAAHGPPAAIHRLTINRNPYTAEYKTPGKARVEIETERGSRRFFHGAGALFVRNSALDARNAFAVTTPDMSRLLSEASFGGPLPRRGWSFFTSGQALADNQAAIISARTLAGPLTRNVPTPERRTILFGRIDFRPGKTHALSARYDLFDDVERGHGVGGLRLVDQAFTTTERRQRLQLDDRRVVSATFANDLRVDAADSHRHDGTLVAGQSNVVAGAFIGGATQTFTVNRSRSVQAADVASFTIGGHALRIGARTKVRWLDVVDGTNFGGAFRFASLGEFSICRPALFSIRSGNPEVSFSDVDADVFAETDFRPRDSIGVTPGLRYDWQSRVADVNNVAPRVSMAFAPGGKKLVFRVGGGLYYRSVPETAVARSRLFGAGGLEETTIPAPPSPLSPSAHPVQQASLNLWQLDPALRTPMTTQATIGAERVLWRRSSIAVEYLAMRTVGALRAHDINAPAPTTLIRPNPRRLNVNQIESTGESRTDAMTVTFRGRIGGFKGPAHYALAPTIAQRPRPG